MVDKAKKVIAIVGPTASGKTGIGVRLAKEFDGEIVSTDSRQVYRRLDLGTGKDLIEYDGVKYHMIDIVDPEQKMTLFDYLLLARKAIEDILSRGKLPIIVGGTGLYVQGLVEGFELKKKKNVIPDLIGDPVLVDSRLRGNDNIQREELNVLTISELNDLLQKLDLQKYERVDHKNRHRLIRAIELAQEGLEPIKIKPDFEVLQIGIDVPRKELHARIDRRVDERFEQGMLEEVEGLIRQGVDPEWLIGLGLEYREITNYLIESRIMNNESWTEIKNHNSKYTIHDTKFEDMKQVLKFKIHQFARRQMTWFRRFPEINWLSNYKEIKRFVKIFLEH